MKVVRSFWLRALVILFSSCSMFQNAWARTHSFGDLVETNEQEQIGSSSPAAAAAAAVENQLLTNLLLHSGSSTQRNSSPIGSGASRLSKGRRGRGRSTNLRNNFPIHSAFDTSSRSIRADGENLY